MRILILSPQNPYPAVDGGKMGILGPVLELAALGHSVGVFFLHDEPTKAAASVAFFGSRQIKAYPLSLSTSDSVAWAIKNIGRRTPFKMAKYYDRRAFEEVLKAAEDFGPDLIQAQHAHMGRYAVQMRRRFEVPIVLREHNIEYRLIEQFCKVESNPVVRGVAYWQYRKTRRYETGLWARFDRIVFISRPDAELAARDVPDVRSEVVQDGVDVAEFTPADAEKEPRSVVFSGSLRTVQNLHSVVWFITEVWPIVRTSEPRARLYLTGGAESVLAGRLRTDVGRLNEQGVFPLGFVEDINGAITRCEVFVSPTRMGSGIRIKVLNAMAMGMPIVCTSLDAESIAGAGHGRHLYVADGPEEFAAGIVELFANERLRERLGLNARELVERRFTWARCARELVDVYEGIIRNENPSA
jgi:glycosyltransferase involved in cell wall biosynthesis